MIYIYQLLGALREVCFFIFKFYNIITLIKHQRGLLDIIIHIKVRYGIAPVDTRGFSYFVINI